MDGAARSHDGQVEDGRSGDGTDRARSPRDRGFHKAGSFFERDTDEAGGIDLARMINLLWRGKWAILLGAFLLGCAGYILAKQQTPIYGSSSLLLITGGQENVIDLNAVMSGIDSSRFGLANQAEVIRSDQLAERVVRKLRLDLDPEFNGALATTEPGFVQRIVQSVAPGFETALYGEAPPPPETLGPADADRIPANTLASVRGAFKSRLTVVAQPQTFALRIGFSSTDPHKAALIANTVADQYIIDQLEAKFEGTQRATVWLNERLGRLKTRVQEAERAVEEYRAQITGESGQSVEITEQQLSQLNAGLIEARAASAEARARYESIRRLSAAGRDVSSAAEVLGSNNVQSARLKLAELRRREAELSTRYGPKHPRMINLRAEMTDVQRTIGGEVGKVVDSVRNELEVAEARERSLQASVDAVQSKSVLQNKGGVRLRELEREAEASRLIYSNFLNRFKETSEQQGLEQTDARVIAKAEASWQPVSPNVRRSVMIGGVLGGALGLAFVFFLEAVNSTFRSSHEFEAATGVPVIANLPKLTNMRQRSDIFTYIRERPNSSFTESVRNLRTSLLLANVDNPPRSILVTSSVPSEGKSALALSLAATSAAMGKRAILVECDLRRPTVKDLFPVQGGADIVAVVSGSAALNDAVVQDPHDDNLFALPGLRSTANPADIFSSRRFRELIESLGDRFDMVVLDSPPVLAVTDARILSEVADITVLASRWDATPRDLVHDALRQLSQVNAPLAGAALTIVDGKKMASYHGGYGKYGRYYSEHYGGYSKYYTN